MLFTGEVASAAAAWLAQPCRLMVPGPVTTSNAVKVPYQPGESVTSSTMLLVSPLDDISTVPPVPPITTSSRPTTSHVPVPSDSDATVTGVLFGKLTVAPGLAVETVRLAL